VAHAPIVAGLRVLLISDWYPERPGDFAGSFVRAQALAVAGDHEVSVLHLRERHAGEGTLHLSEEQDGPLRTLRVRHSRPPAPATAINLWAVAAAVRRLRRAGAGPDLLHAHEFGAGFPAVVLGRLLGYPVIVSEHYSGFAQGEVTGVAAQLAQRTFAAADLVCPVSESLHADLVKGGWRRGPIEVVPNVVDTTQFWRDGDPPEPGTARIVAVASLDPVKGIANLVDAAAILAGRRGDFEVEIVGDGPLRPALERRARALGLGGRLSFRGLLPREEVAALMRRSAFAVVPSVWETFSVVLSEAMACGLPVVATDVGGMPERVHAANGILSAPEDPAALARAMERMLDTHRTYDRAAIAAAVREGYSAAAVGARWRRIYRDVVARSGRGMS